MTTGEAPSYASWFSDPATAAMYTQAQHNGSVATAKYLVKKKLQLGSVTSMLDVGGGSGAFSYVIVERAPDRPSFAAQFASHIAPHCLRTQVRLRREHSGTQVDSPRAA